MIKFYQLTRIADGFVTKAAADEDEVVLLGAPAGYASEEWEVVELEREPREFDRVENGVVLLDAAAIDAALHARIDREAGAFRLNFITDVPGQQGTYIEKLRQALLCLAEEDEAEWAMIAGEAALRGITPHEMAAMIVGIAFDWRAIDALIENKRIGAKLAVSAATTLEAKRAAAEIDWAALLVPPQGQGGE